MTAVPLLGVVLEALLAVQDFTAFEKLLPLLEQTGLAASRAARAAWHRSTCAAGFLASAAEEWMAVCEQQPDSRALVGLAQVAAAHGLPDEAANFAAEALALDRGNLLAGELLSRYQTAEAA